MKTRFGEIPFTHTHTQNPWKRLHVFLFTITGLTLICTLRSFVRHSHPGSPPMWPSRVLPEAPVGWAAIHYRFSLLSSRSFSGVCLGPPFSPWANSPDWPDPPSALVVTQLALAVRPGGERAVGGHRGEGKCARHVCVQCPGHGRIPRPAPTHRKPLLGSRFSATLGNLSWAMTCTHLASVLPNNTDEFAQFSALSLLSSGKHSSDDQHPVPVTVFVPNSADKGFFLPPCVWIQLIFLARARIWKMYQTMMPY